MVNLSREGIATARSWIIIDALIYGETPSARNEPFASAPPLMELNKFKKSFPAVPVWKAAVSIPGIGSQAPTLKINKRSKTLAYVSPKRKDVFFKEDRGMIDNLYRNEKLLRA